MYVARLDLIRVHHEKERLEGLRFRVVRLGSVGACRMSWISNVSASTSSVYIKASSSIRP